MSAALSFIAGLGAGYMSGKDKAREKERQDKLDARAEEEYQFKKSEREQAKADKDALRVAGADVAVQEETKAFQAPADSMDNDMPVAAANTVPLAKSYKVGAKDFAGDGVAAQAEAAKQSSIDGKRTRTMAALAAQGNVVGADQMRTSGMQADAAQVTLDSAKQAVADKALKARIDGFKTPEDMAAFMSESPADKNGGAFKAQVRYSADKKTFTFDKVNPDGTLTPTGKEFKNMDEAKMTLAGFMTPEQRLQHYQFEETKAESARHNKEMEGIAKQNANTNEQYRKDQAAHLRETASRLAANAKAADAPPTWSKDADEHIVKLNTSKNPETNREELDGNGAQFMQAVALDVARKNGGNTMAAISRAAEVDAALKAKAKGDPALLAQLRNEAFAAASGRAAAPQPTQQPAQPQQPVVNAASVAQGGVTPPAAAQAPAPVRPMSTVDQMQAKTMAALVPLAQQVKQANQMFMAAAKSGDQKSMTQYMQAKESLRAQLEQQVNEKFGNGAPAVLQKLYAN